MERMGSETQMLKCTGCGTIFSDLSMGQCSRCGGILLVEYAPGYLERGQEALETRREGNGIGVFRPVLPEISLDSLVSLGECGTPYLEGTKLADQVGLASLWLKDESRNPTGSFKDRAISLCVSAAKSFGCKRIVAASSGNGAASAAAYGARAGIETIVVVPETAPAAKTVHAQTCGARIHRILGGFDRSYRYAKELAKGDGVMNLTTTFLSPMGVEGYKTIAYELYFQAAELPEYIFIPVGAGPLLYGIYKGFAELKETGRIERIPRLAAVQSQGCAPIARAWESGTKTVCWTDPGGVASAISDPLKGYEDNGDLAVSGILASGGFAVTVGDGEILAAGKMLGSMEGLFVEPSSASALAGLLKAKREGRILSSDSAALILTGSGLKDPGKYLD